MLIVLSPAKSLNFEPQTITKKSTRPLFQAETEMIAARMKQMPASEIATLMSVSDKLASLNYERYQSWGKTAEKPKAAIFAFDGDVYDGLDAGSFTEEQVFSAQKKIRILSGLYGVLRPLDLIRPHRLEMGTKLDVGGCKNLYEFWGGKLTTEISKAVLQSGSNILLNLASNEYFKSLDSKYFKSRLVSAEFKDLSNGSYKIVSFYAKRARGLMTRFVLDHQIENPDDLKAFDSEGYRFSPGMSSENRLTFIRDH
jgi:hypothetical protein